MPNPAIARLISARLRGGLIHPGDPANNVAAQPIVLPFASRAGMPKEMVDLMDATTTMMGEAIVALIEGEGESLIVDRDQFEDLRQAGEPEGRVLAVHCRCDRKRIDPLMLLTVDGRPHIRVDGKQLITALTQRTVECPHRRTE